MSIIDDPLVRARYEADDAASRGVDLSPGAPDSAADQLIDAWFAETFHGIPLAVEYLNRFRAAAEELKKRLGALKG